MKNDIITVNGKRYDSVSGLPVAKPAPQYKKTSSHPKKIPDAKSLHSLNQKSQTLYRRATQKPIAHSAGVIRKVGRNLDMARSKSISHFAKTPSLNSLRPTLSSKQTLIAPKKHPMVEKAESRRPSAAVKPAPTKPTLFKSPKIIKEEAISEVMKKTEKKSGKQSFFKRRIRLTNIFAILIVTLTIGGALLYLNFPNLSVGIASAQAGINATFPTYFPDGYRLSGPVTYSEGSVKINFNANTGGTKFSIEQTKSTWDSSAVKNMVQKASKSEFMTTEDQGLTIFTYGGNAAWVNGGILYMISGDAHLSSDQIRRIAISL